MKRRLTTLASELSKVDKEMIVEKYQGAVQNCFVHFYKCDNLARKCTQ